MELTLSRVDYAHVGTTANGILYFKLKNISKKSSTPLGCLKVIHTASNELSNRRLSILPSESTTESGEQLSVRLGLKESKKKINKTENETDKLIIGDQNGVLLCMERKDGNTNVCFELNN